VLNYSSFEAPADFYTVLPFGAITFALFLICYFLETEASKYDKEQDQNMSLLFKTSSVPRKSSVGISASHAALGHS
jgi:hypothetical protein